MPDEVPVDTNVLVYAFDPEHGVKQARANGSSDTW